MSKHLTVLVPEFLVNTSSFPQELAQHGNQFNQEGFEGSPSSHSIGGKNNHSTLESIESVIRYVFTHNVTLLMNGAFYLQKNK